MRALCLVAAVDLWCLGAFFMMMAAEAVTPGERAVLTRFSVGTLILTALPIAVLAALS